MKDPSLKKLPFKVVVASGIPNESLADAIKRVVHNYPGKLKPVGEYRKHKDIVSKMSGIECNK